MIEGAVLIAGPTASGKSRLAMEIASQTGGVIVNTDSMQVYSQLRVLTARPADEDLAAAPHLLYGHADPSIAYSTGQWVRDVARLAEAGKFASRPAIFVGGTGLYFRALTEGLSEMPDVPEAIRSHWRSRLQEEGPAELHKVLAVADPLTAAQLRPNDGQRIVRALEVLEASGRSIRDWQMEKGTPLVNPASARRLVLNIDRALLRERINTRFDQMVEGGALDEVRTLLTRGLDPALPAMRAIGVPELADYLREKLTLGKSVDRAKIATAQYAKRQMTWFRNQMGAEWKVIRAEEAKRSGFVY